MVKYNMLFLFGFVVILVLGLSSCLIEPPGIGDPEGTGLTGSYFDSQSVFVDSRVDSVIDFDWGYGSPLNSVPDDNFSIIWVGQIEFPADGSYTFFANSDDGIRLFIDGSSDLFDGSAWVDQGMDVENSVTRSFTAGKKNIRIEYYEKRWNSGLKISWQGPGISKEVIPMMYLYPGSTVNTAPSGLPYDGIVQPPPSNECDNNIIEGTEQCDNGTMNGILCNPPLGGSCTYCSDDCRIVTLTDLEDPNKPPNVQEISYTPMGYDVFIKNPERGWYGWGNMTAENPGFRNFYNNGNEFENRGLTLAHGAIRLDEWKNNPQLPSWVLTRINNSFIQARAAGIKLIPRVSYNFGNAADAPESVILSHIQQLAPIYQENSDVIALIQAGFIGYWGEWHTSQNGLTSDTQSSLDARSRIVNSLFNNIVRDDRMLQLRYPMAHIEHASGSLIGSVPTNSYSNYAPTEDDAFTSSQKARIGIYNDCLLTGTYTVNDTEYITDVGTYDWAASRMRQLFDFTIDVGKYTGIGGETCDYRYEPVRASCWASGTYPYYGAVHELDLLGYDYLNSGFYIEHKNLWRSQGCYDQITNRLGYRYSLLQGVYSSSVNRGNDMYVSLTIRNDGFGKLYNPRPLEIMIRRNDGLNRTFVLAEDARLVLPLSNETMTITRGIRIPNDMPTGTYQLYLALPDASSRIRNDPRYSIRLANTGNMWDSSTGLNNLGASIQIN